MVTLYLMVSVLAKTLESKPRISRELDAEAIRQSYLLSEVACKLSASRPDRKSVEYVVLGAALPPEDEQP